MDHTKEYQKKYREDNKEKWESYVECTPRIYCPACGKDYKWNYFPKHIKTSYHKACVIKKSRERAF